MTIKASRMFDRDMQHESWRRTKDEKEATVRNHRTIIVLKCCGDIYGGSSGIV